jgi:glycosyltransferase involved in cell wall biosynthesis
MTLRKTQANPDLSIVIPMYNETENLRKLFSELMLVLPTLGMTWEIICVDDGSSDDLWSEIVLLCQEQPAVKGVRLSRNFGHQYALFAGLTHAAGQAVITMDADLQHPPQTIPRLVDEWRHGSKIVHTIRISPKTLPYLKRLMSRWYYKVFSFLSGVTMDQGMADFRLLDRQVVNEIVRLKEGALFLRGLVRWVGYPSSKVEFLAAPRFSGSTKYTFWKMLKFAWCGITSFSIVPLRIGILLGLVTTLAAVYQLIDAIYTRLFTNNAVPGWASVIGLMSLLFGVLFILLGIFGEYLARVLEEVRGRPRFIISEQIGLAPSESPDQIPYPAGISAPADERHMRR